jgi:hypothetical protein
VIVVSFCWHVPHSPEICAGSPKLIRGISSRYCTFKAPLGLEPLSNRLILNWNLASPHITSPHLKLRGWSQAAIYSGETPCQARLPLIYLTLHCVAIATIRPVVHREFEAVNMSDRGARIAGVTTALYALSFVAVSVRCYVRGYLIRSFGYDDWLIVATLVRLLE